MNTHHPAVKVGKQSRIILGCVTAAVTGLLVVPLNLQSGPAGFGPSNSRQSPTESQSAEAKTPTAHSVDVLYAGSMASVMEGQIKPQAQRHLGLSMEGEAAGSSELAQFIKSGQKRADLFISASPSVIQTDLMGPQNHHRASWYLTMAGDSLVIAYNPRSRFRTQLNAAKNGTARWYDVLSEKGFRLGRTDPKLDPKGLYSLLMGRLADRYYHQPSLDKSVFGSIENPAQVFPEEDLIARLETGQVDAAITYRHEAVEWHLPYVTLPAAINLGSPRYAKQYSTATIRLEKTTKRGGVIEFALTIPNNARDAADAANLAKYLINGPGHRLLMKAGFTSVPILLSGSRAAVPKSLQPLIQGEFQIR